MPASKTRIPPFFGNTKDNIHCFQASMRMLLKHHFPHKNFTWKKLESLSGFKKNVWTWPNKMIGELAKMGFEVQVIDNFNRKEFIRRGGDYLIEIWGKIVGEAQIHNSDIRQEQHNYTNFPKTVSFHERAATMRDIELFLKRGYLVECNVNSAILNKRVGYAGHSVLVYNIDKRFVHLHDPGLPPRPQSKIPRNLFLKAWGRPAVRSLLAFRLQQR